MLVYSSAKPIFSLYSAL